MALEGEQLAAAGRVPHLGRPVPTPRRQPRSVRRPGHGHRQRLIIRPPGHGRDFARMSREGEQLAAAGCVLNDIYREAAAQGIELKGAQE